MLSFFYLSPPSSLQTLTRLSDVTDEDTDEKLLTFVSSFSSPTEIAYVSLVS